VIVPGSKACKAFTIVELIAVVAIVLILTAIVVFRTGRVTNDARNALIQNFLKDSRTIYHNLSYGNPPDFSAITSQVLYGDYVAGTTLSAVQLQLNDAGKLSIDGLPASLFRDHRTSLQIDYANRTYDGDAEEVFLQRVLW
jgi:prepilin-type N-terminal cleavage/methylation domain-containing protein